MGGDTRGPYGYRGDIWNELQEHAGAGHSVRLLRRARPDADVLSFPVRPLQASQVAVMALRTFRAGRSPRQCAPSVGAQPLQSELEVR